MKKYFVKLALLALSTTAFVSCDEDTVTYGGDNFVSFNQVARTRFNAFENVGVAEIPVNLAFPKSSDVVVTFKIENSTAVEGVDYVLLTPGTVTIPAGETTANIRIQITNNDVQNDSKSMEITLTSVSQADVSLGLVDNGSKFKRLLIVNDDCTTNFLPFIGTYNVLDADNVVIGSAEADVNDNADCNVLRLTGVLEDLTSGTNNGSYIDVTLSPAGANKDAGTITSVQQLYCESCFTYEQKSNTVLLKVGGNFSNTTGTNPTSGVKQLLLNSEFYLATSTTALTSRSVRLRAIN